MKEKVYKTRCKSYLNLNNQLVDKASADVLKSIINNNMKRAETKDEMRDRMCSYCYMYVQGYDGT